MISDEKNRVHSNIYNPDYGSSRRDTATHSRRDYGLSEDGAIIVNSTKEPAEVRELLGGYRGKVCTVDAGKISRETLA